MLIKNEWASKKCSVIFKKEAIIGQELSVKREQLIALTLLITFADYQSIMVGEKIGQKGVANYVNRRTETKRKYRRQSHFYRGNRRQAWLNYWEIFAEEAEELMANCPQKRLNYQKGRKAARLVK